MTQRSRVGGVLCIVAWKFPKVFFVSNTSLGMVSNKEKKKLMEFSIKGPDPASQHLNGKKNKIKHGLKML